MDQVAELIYLAATDLENRADFIRKEVDALSERYPIYQ
jgi:glycine hydroxymethyltransferase